MPQRQQQWTRRQAQRQQAHWRQLLPFLSWREKLLERQQAARSTPWAEELQVETDIVKPVRLRHYCCPRMTLPHQGHTQILQTYGQTRRLYGPDTGTASMLSPR